MKNHNDEAVKCITETAASINDHLRERAERVERRRKKWEQGKNLESQEAEEEELRLMKEKVEKLTETLEKAIRGCIDEGMGARRIEEVLEWLRREANVLMEREYETQVSQRSQAQSQSQRRRQTGGEDDMYEDEGPTPGPTPLGRERVALTGLSEMFVDRMDRKKDEYSMFSHQARYAQNNDYIGFKQLVHDARYGDDGPPLPHPDTWFSKRGRPALGVTAPQTAGEDDDDLIIDKANISIRCPITFGKFQEPYSSKKCPHTFEKTAILSMIRNARPRGSVQCPVSGCDQVSPLSLYPEVSVARTSLY